MNEIKQGENIIPDDPASIFDALTTLQRQAIVRPTNPPPGIAGFLFDIVGDEMVELESDITDNYTENNTTFQDQAALKPERITVRGLVAELTDAPGVPGKPVFIPNALPINPTMTPALTTSQTATFTTSKSSLALRGADSLYQYFANYQAFGPNGRSASLTKQADAFLYFRQLWLSRIPFTVQTCYGIWTSMLIERCRPVQEEDSRYRSNFTVVFKKIRIAGDILVQPGQLAGRAVPQMAPVTPNGLAGTTPATAAQVSQVQTASSWTQN